MLCRNLQDNPNIVENNHKIQKERTAVYDLLERTVRDTKRDWSKWDCVQVSGNRWR